MSNLSVAAAVEKSRVASDVPYLLFVEIIVPPSMTEDGKEFVIPLVQNNEDVLYQGRTYTAAGMRIDIRSEAGSMPSITLSVDDLKGVVRSYMEQYGGGVGFTVRVFGQFTNALEFEPDFDIDLIVQSASAPDYAASFSLGAENPMLTPFPGRRARRDTCSNTFGDQFCRYAGPLPGPCDYTLQGPNGCKKYGNTRNFTGFPGINNSGIRYGRA